MRGDWVDEGRGEPEVDISRMTERERELLKEATPFQVRAYGTLDQATAEAMLVGYLVGNSDKEGDAANVSAPEKLLEAGIQGTMFENADLGALFDDMLGFYRKYGRKAAPDDASTVCMVCGQDRNAAAMYRKMLVRCYSSVLIRKTHADLVLEFFLSHHLQKEEDRIYQIAVAERRNPVIGPRKSWENMRKACIERLVDPRTRGLVRTGDCAGGGAGLGDWLRDMRDNPERHRGHMCGIRAIDFKTMGFRDGHLTVFAASHGGFKSMTMLNVAFGLWERGCSVLYVSLEMEQQLVMLRLYCRALGLSFTQAYGGKVSDEALAEVLRFAEDAGKKPNRFKFLDFGQSRKIKPSQIESWLEEQPDFRPQAVIVDYLDLMTSESENWDRPDVAAGDVCKALRGMGKARGFSVITAAQLNRKGLELARKHGMDSPEKARLDTDFIAGSHQIGADADSVFVLWNVPGEPSKLRLFTAKARNGVKDVTAGETLFVDGDKCLVKDWGGDLVFGNDRRAG